MTEQPTCKTLPDGSKVWFLNGKLHRTDGPAIEYPDGSKEWYSDGKRLTEAEYAKRTRLDAPDHATTRVLEA